MAVAKFRIPMINARSSRNGADAVNLSVFLFQGQSSATSGRCRGKKRQFAELAKLEERNSGLRAGKNSHAERSFLSRWQVSSSR